MAQSTEELATLRLCHVYVSSLLADFGCTGDAIKCPYELLQGIAPQKRFTRFDTEGADARDLLRIALHLSQVQIHR